MNDVADLTTLHAQTRSNIDQHGQSVVAVFGGQPFAYTIGNAEKGLPELLLVGRYSPEFACTVLNGIGAAMRARGWPLEEHSFGGKFPVKLRPAGPDARTEYTIQAGQFLDTEDYGVLQVLIPDPAGHYPGEPECETGYAVPLI